MERRSKDHARNLRSSLDARSYRVCHPCCSLRRQTDVRASRRSAGRAAQRTQSRARARTTEHCAAPIKPAIMSEGPPLSRVPGMFWRARHVRYCQHVLHAPLPAEFAAGDPVRVTLVRTGPAARMASAIACKSRSTACGLC
jgi:hypothetical protein